MYKKAKSDKISEEKNLGQSCPMKVSPLYFSVSRDSLNKRFANIQNVASIENLSIKRLRAIKLAKIKNIGNSGLMKEPLLYFSNYGSPPLTTGMFWWLSG